MEIIAIECALLSRVSQKIVATKWRIYTGKMFCQIGHLSRDRAHILYLKFYGLRTYAQYASMNEFTCSEHSKKHSTGNQPLVAQNDKCKSENNQLVK